MEIKDYLHLYLGCWVLLEKSNYYFVHELAIHKGDKFLMNAFRYKCIADRGNKLAFKLILRPLRDMTDKEKDELDNAIEFEKKYGHDSLELRFELRAEQIRFLISKHLDVFNLIPAGLAIDSTTMPNSVLNVKEP